MHRHLARVRYLLVAIAAVAGLLVTGDSHGLIRPTPALAATVQLYGTAHVDPQGDGQGVSGFYRIDPATGAATLIATTKYRGISGMDFHPDTGVLYAVGRRVSDDEAYLITINPETGATNEIGSINNEDFQRVPDISFRNSDRKLFAWDENLDELATISLATGAMTTFGLDIGGAGHGMAFSPGDTLYLAQSNNLVVLNQTTGAIASTIGAFSGMPGVTTSASALEFSPLTGQMYAVLTSRDNLTPQRYLGIVNTATAAVTVIGQSVDGLDAIAMRVPTSPVSEPTRERANVGGAVGAIGAAAAQQAQENRATAAAAVQPVATTAPISPPRTGTGITPPNTGEAGLADQPAPRPWMWLAPVVLIPMVVVLVRAVRRR